MADLNKVFLIGRLTFDPELRWTPPTSASASRAVADLRLATSRSWTGKDGERKEDTLYIDVTVWDRQAEHCCQYLKKGSQVHVEGSLKMDSWDDRTTGEKKTKIKVLADRVQFLDRRTDLSPTAPEGDSGPPQAREVPPPRRAGGYSADSRGPGNGPARGSYPPPSPPPGRRPSPVEPEGEDEDIPF